MEDLFEKIEELPSDVQLLIDDFNYASENHDTDIYIICYNFVKDLKKIGYICDYDLSGQPYDLRKL